VEIADLVRALLAYDALAARQWVADAVRSGFAWSEIPRPVAFSEVELAVAAGVLEMLAARSGVKAPSWTQEIGQSPRAIFLVRAAEIMPRLRILCETEGPAPLRLRRLFAPPDFLTAA
jgi:hypothetical protein